MLKAVKSKFSVVNSEHKRRRQCHSCILYNNGLYIYGGFRFNVYLSDLLHYDIQKAKWSLLKPKSKDTPGKKSAHSAVLFRDSMLLFGGKCDDSTRCADIWNLDLRTLVWKLERVSGDVPSKRSSHSAVMYKDCMIVFGGFDGYFTQSHMNDLYVYKPLQKVWIKLNPKGEPPSPRGVHSAVVHNNSMYVFGGEDDFVVHNDLYEYKILQNSWHKIEQYCDVPTPRCAARSVVIGDKIFLAGGESRNNCCDGNLFEFHIPTGKWKELKQSIGKRSDHSMVVEDNVCYVFGGVRTNQLGDLVTIVACTKQINPIQVFSILEQKHWVDVKFFNKEDQL